MLTAFTAASGEEVEGKTAYIRSLDYMLSPVKTVGQRRLFSLEMQYFITALSAYRAHRFHCRL